MADSLESPPTPQPPFQFSLRSLLLVTLGFAVFCWIGTRLPPETLRALLTRAGGEAVEPEGP